VLVALLAVSALPSVSPLSSWPAGAQESAAGETPGAEPADSGDGPEVERLVARAISLRAEGKDREALAVLLQAAQVDPHSLRVHVHLSNVYQALGEWLLADELLRRALAAPRHPYIQRHRQALTEARSVIDDHLGKLEVVGEPPGAEVWLNGRQIGTLPLAEPVPVTVGSYTLEVRMAGHYPVSRPLSIAARDHVRESIRLAPRLSEESAAPSGARTSSQPPPERPAERRWLTWTLAGLGAAAAATTAGALIYREEHARRWNDDSRCVGTERTRAELCGSERDKVEVGDAWAIGAGVATGVFAAAALLNVYVFVEDSGVEQAGLAGCGVGLQGASCFGSF
jgi:tetratricopeptide (TPR) repeat protein